MLLAKLAIIVSLLFISESAMRKRRAVELTTKWSKDEDNNVVRIEYTFDRDNFTHEQYVFVPP